MRGSLPAVRERDDPDTRALVAVHRLQAAYGDAVTRRAWSEVLALFEPDAVVHIDTRTREPFALHGSAELVAFIERSLEQFTFFELTILNAVSDVDGATAHGRVHLCEVRCDRAGEWTTAYGLYQDRYRRRDGTWRIAERHYHSLARTGARTEAFGLPPDEPGPPIT
jgi:hypothetical protein